MSALTTLTNDQLRSRLSQLCHHSRKLDVEIITCLQEVESRLLHWELGFSSIYDYAIQEIKMSEGEAHRRIAAMRALTGLPELKTKLQTGELTVTNLAQVQKCIRAQDKESGVQITIEQKRELIAKVENKSSREAEKILVELMPEQAVVKEVIKPISQTQSRVTLVIEDSLMQKLEKLKHLMAHRNSSYTLSELIDELANQALKKWDKSQKQITTQSRIQKPEVTHGKLPKHQGLREADIAPNLMDEVNKAAMGEQSDANRKFVTQQALQQTEQQNKHTTNTGAKRSRHIPAAVRGAVWQRDQGCCSYKSEATAHVCKSTYKLELDHSTPWAKGGANSLSNLTLRCRGHNTLNAVQSFGKKHMSQWLAGTR